MAKPKTKGLKAGQEFTMTLIFDGDTVIAEVDGIKGPVCEALADQILEGLGETVEHKRKPEYQERAPKVKAKAKTKATVTAR